MSSVLDSFKKLLRISEDETKLTDAESKRLQRFQVLEEINQYVCMLACARAERKGPRPCALMFASARCVVVHTLFPVARSARSSAASTR